MLFNLMTELITHLAPPTERGVTAVTGTALPRKTADNPR